ncbi:MAG: phospholipase [Solirubrobacterales bacterium]|nr:phospholipase [Solirubrobacterales bacterium]
MSGDRDRASEAEARERFEAEQPEESLRRREFLGRTAALAGLAGLAATLPAETLISEAAQVQTRTPFPSPSNMPIDNFVVLMMENRSFDHYFGWLPGADGRNAGLSYPDDDGTLHPTHNLAPDFQGCAYHDPDHSWEGGRTQYAGGALNGFRKSPNDDFAIGYYLENDVPYIPKLAKAFTLYDRYFCSLLGPTFPNRHYQWSAQSGGERTNVLPPRGRTGEQWETIFDRAQARGLSVRYYASDQPFGLLYGPRALNWTRPIEEYYADAAAGNLPNLAFVDPPFLDGGGGDGLSGDEHPHGDIRIGQSFISEVSNAFLTSPQFRTGALFVNYDEWGGFFDHVAPRFVPDDRQSSDLDESFGVSGFRIPGVAVSPYVRRGHVSHATVTHESILKLVSYRFGLGYLNKRHRYASNIGRTFDWTHPNFDVPGGLAPVTPPATTPCRLQGSGLPLGPPSAQTSSREGLELSSPELSEYAASLGYPVAPPRADRVFQTPALVERVKQLWGQS